MDLGMSHPHSILLRGKSLLYLTAGKGDGPCCWKMRSQLKSGQAAPAALAFSWGWAGGYDTKLSCPTLHLSAPQSSSAPHRLPSTSPLPPIPRPNGPTSVSKGLRAPCCSRGPRQLYLW